MIAKARQRRAWPMVIERCAKSPDNHQPCGTAHSHAVARGWAASAYGADHIIMSDPPRHGRERVTEEWEQ